MSKSRLGTTLRSKKGTIFFFLTLFAVRALFINYNFAEWGDSYRFLSAGEHLFRLSYPLNEKRLPFYPLILAPSSFFSNPILYARVLSFIIFCQTLVLTFSLALKVSKSRLTAYFAVLLLFLNPIFFYWSLRIMAVNLLALLAVFSCYIFEKMRESSAKFVLLGFLTSLAFLTRYEGFFLFFAFALALFIRGRIKDLAIFSVSSLLGVSPWLYRSYLLFKNPFASSYFSEPAEFGYSFKELGIFTALVLFLFASPFLWSLVLKGKDSWRNLLPATLYTISIFLTGILWPAAIPRIFVSIVPLFSIIVVRVFLSARFGKREAVAGILLILSFIALRLLFRRPFLLFGKVSLLVVVLLNSVALFWSLFNFRITKYVSLFLVALCQIIVLSSVLRLHRDVGKTVKEASLYVISHGGRGAYFDETGVTSYYLDNSFGKKYDEDALEKGQYDWMLKNKLNYIIETNEHNEGDSLTFYKTEKYKKSAVEVAKFKGRIGRSVTWTKVFEFKSNL